MKFNLLRTDGRVSVPIATIDESSGRDGIVSTKGGKIDASLLPIDSIQFKMIEASKDASASYTRAEILELLTGFYTKAETDTLIDTVDELNYAIDAITLQADDITNKHIHLSATPTSRYAVQRPILLSVGGLTMLRGVDYEQSEVDLTLIYWGEPLLLRLSLEANDVMIITYERE